MARTIVIGCADHSEEVVLSFTGPVPDAGQPDSEQRHAFTVAIECDARAIFTVLRTCVPSATYDKLGKLFVDRGIR